MLIALVAAHHGRQPKVFLKPMITSSWDLVLKTSPSAYLQQCKWLQTHALYISFSVVLYVASKHLYRVSIFYLLSIPFGTYVHLKWLFKTHNDQNMEELILSITAITLPLPTEMVNHSSSVVTWWSLYISSSIQQIMLDITEVLVWPFHSLSCSAEPPVSVSLLCLAHCHKVFMTMAASPYTMNKCSLIKVRFSLSLCSLEIGVALPSVKWNDWNSKKMIENVQDFTDVIIPTKKNLRR